MSKCIPVNIAGVVGILCTVNTDFKCPKCGYVYHEEDYYTQLYNSKRGVIYKKCKGCKTSIGITSDIRGDVRVWLREDETELLNDMKGSLR